MRNIILVLALLGVGVNLNGQDPVVAKKSWWDRTTVNTIMELRSAYEFHDSVIQKLEFLVTPEVEIPFNKKIRLVAIGRLYVETTDKLEPGEPEQTAISQFSKRLSIGKYAELELREFYLDWKINKHYVTIGKQQIVWGEADGLKILDVVNPMNMREFLLDDFDNSRIPLWSIKADLKLGKLKAQPIWIPDLSYNDVPGQDAVFFPGALFAKPPVGLNINQSKVDKPDDIIEDSDVGIKLSSFIDGWGVTANYLYHYDDFPVARLTKGNSAGEPVLFIKPEYKRHHLVGGTFNKTLGKFIFRGELAFALDKSFNSSDPSFSDGIAITNQFIGVFGLDYSGISNTQVSIQWFEDVLFEDVGAVARNEEEQFVTFLLSRNFNNQTLTANFIIVQNFTHGDGFVKPFVKYMIKNSLYGILGADIFYGDRNALFGQFQDRTRLTLALELGL